MTIATGHDKLLADVLAAFAGTDDPRLREIVTAAVEHLHALVSDVGLTHEEWQTGIDFLTAVGAACTPTRQEFILLSDTLGVSTRMETVSARLSDDATANTVLGPFYVPGSPMRPFGASIVEEPDPSPTAFVNGRVTDLDGTPIAGACLDIWQNSGNRLYAVQDPAQSPTNLRGRFLSDEDGRFAFTTVRPVPYPIPDDGPVGAMLRATDRHPWRPAHIHFLITADGYRPLTTHVFDADSAYLDSDAVFGVQGSLATRFDQSPDGGPLRAEFDFALEPVAG